MTYLQDIFLTIRGMPVETAEHLASDALVYILSAAAAVFLFYQAGHLLDWICRQLKKFRDRK